MEVAKALLDRLVGAETKQDLDLAGKDIVRKLNQKIKKGTLTTRGGNKVTESVNGALIRNDKKVLYMIRDDVPIMLIDEAIPMKELN